MTADPPPSGRPGGHARPPGPRGTRLLGSLGEFRRDPLRFLQSCARDHGGLAYFRLGPSSGYLVSDPVLAEEILVGGSSRYIKDTDTRDLRTLLGLSLLTSEGETWKAHRRLLSPPLQAHHIGLYARTMTAAAEGWASRLREGETRDITQDAKRATLEIVGQTLFGADPEGEVRILGDSIDVAMRCLDVLWHSWYRILPRWAPVPPRLRLRTCVRRMDQVLFRLIESGARQPSPGGDLLSILRRSDHGLSAREVRDEALTMLVAGHETTALALAYGLFLLAGHPEEQDRLLEDSRQDPSGLEGPRSGDYLEAAVREILRMYPPAWLIGREALEDVDVGGYRIPRGSQVYLSPWVNHHDPRWFPDPEHFRPDRWIKGLSDRLPRMAYLPFGGGPRTCIGNHFALLELKVVLGTLLRHASFSPVPDYVLELFPSVTLRPRKNIRLRVSLRGGGERPAALPSAHVP